VVAQLLVFVSYALNITGITHCIDYPLSILVDAAICSNILRSYMLTTFLLRSRPLNYPQSTC